GCACLRATAVTSTTVSPIETRTAPSARRASSPVSRVTVWDPNWKDCLAMLTGDLVLAMRCGHHETAPMTKQAARFCACAARGARRLAAETQPFDDFLVL